MFTSPSPPLTPETERRIKLLFSPDQQSAATSALLTRCGSGLPGFRHLTLADIERFRFAALKLGEGNLSKLQSALDLVNLDFRDLLIQADFGDPDAHWNWLPQQRV